MVAKLEVSVKPNLTDSLAEAVKKRVKHDLGIELKEVRTKRVYFFDTELSKQELETAKQKIFTDSQVDISSFDELNIPYDWRIDVAETPCELIQRKIIAGGEPRSGMYAFGRNLEQDLGYLLESLGVI